jgi:hypothetical protein
MGMMRFFNCTDISGHSGENTEEETYHQLRLTKI